MRNDKEQKTGVVAEDHDNIRFFFTEKKLPVLARKKIDKSGEFNRNSKLQTIRLKKSCTKIQKCSSDLMRTSNLSNPL